MLKIIFILLAFTMTGASANAVTATPSYKISVTLPIIKQGSYHRPYLALWVENKNKTAKRSIAVWMKKDRWLADLRRYWRRVARSEREIVDGVTGATKGPGIHTFTWNGLDDSGKALAKGLYSVCLEVVREKGGREAVCTDINYGITAQASMTGQHEVTRLDITLN